MAGVKLHIATSNVWNHFFENIERLQDNEDCIAENKDNGMSLYITAVAICPQLVLYAKDTPVLYRMIGSDDECNKWAIYLITRFLAGIPTEGNPVETEE